MKTTCPGRSNGHSEVCGSFTLTIMSARPRSRPALSTMVAPAEAYWESAIPLPCPAPDSNRTVWPALVSSSAPTGSMATRYSSALISLGTPTIIRRNSPRQARQRSHQLHGRGTDIPAAVACHKHSIRPGLLNQGTEIDRRLGERHSPEIGLAS